MVRFRGASSSLARWIVPASDATRGEIILELQTAVQNHQFDSQTLEDIILILWHECLCCKYEADGNLFSTGQNSGAFRQTLETPQASQLVELFSSCLVQVISPSTHYLRELQSKALLSALTLLHAHGATGFQADFHDDLREQFAARFQDLQGVPRQRAVFSAETIRNLQCGYYLCLGAEYAKHFRKAEPVVISVVSRVVNLLGVGASITSAAMGTGPPSVQSTLKGLEKAFKPISTSPNKLFRSLYDLQELTTIAIALYAYGEVMKGIDETAHKQSQSCCVEVAKMILSQILLIFDSDQGFDMNAGPSSVIIDYFVAFFTGGPNDLDLYLYQYGLLDCMSQLSGVVDLKKLSVEISNVLLKIIAMSQVESYRWKCTEILLRHPATRGTQLQKIPDAVVRSNPNMAEQEKSQLQSQLRTEIEQICELLDEEDGMSTTPRTSIVGSQEVAATGILSPSGWIERIQPRFTARELVNDTQKLSISLPSSYYHKAGLSPNGMYAYFIGTKNLSLYPLPKSNSTRRVDRTERIPQLKIESNSKSEYREAVLSNSFLAVLKDSRADPLEVYKYSSQAPNCSLTAIGETSEGIQNEHPWLAKCLAICEVPKCAWVAVGGGSGKNGIIRIYRIDVDGRNFSRHNAYFHRSRLASDFVKSIAFSPDGQRLVCVTNKNRILVWLLSNNARPTQPPFEIKKKYVSEMMAQGVTSAVLFKTASSNQYVLCTTWPSNECAKNDFCELSFISAVGAGPATVPSELEHYFERLHQVKAKAIIAGAVSPNGRIIALLAETGRIIIIALVAKERGGLSSLDPIILEKAFKSLNSASPTALQFCEVDGRLCLLAVNPKGFVIRQYFQEQITG